MSAGKKFILNLNNYRNAHHFTLNKAKKLYSQLVVNQLPPGNQVLFNVSVLDAEHARKVKLAKKKYDKEPAVFSMIESKMNARHEHARKLLLVGITYLKKIRVTKQVYVHYTYFAASRRRIDVANPCSIIDKFTCDALTAAGTWPDDDTNTIKRTIYEAAAPDKDNPRCELRILVAPVQEMSNNPLF